MEFKALLEVFPDCPERTLALEAVDANDGEGCIAALKAMKAAQLIPTELADTLITNIRASFAIIENDAEAFAAIELLRGRIDPQYHWILDELKKFFELPDGVDIEMDIPDLDDLIEAYPHELLLCTLASYMMQVLTRED